MPWWGWVLVWLALLLGAGVVLGLLALRLWRGAKALMSEVSRAEREVAGVSAAVAGLGAGTGAGAGTGRSRPLRREAAWDEDPDWGSGERWASG